MPQLHRNFVRSTLFRATMLLANNEPSDSHRAFLGKKARELTSAVLKVFWPSAKGSLHHACCVLDYLLRSYADEVGSLVLEPIVVATLSTTRIRSTPIPLGRNKNCTQVKRFHRATCRLFRDSVGVRDLGAVSGIPREKSGAYASMGGVFTCF